MIGNIQKLQNKAPSTTKFRPTLRSNKRELDAKHKNSAEFIDTSVKFQLGIESESQRSDLKKIK